ncbi:MAG TPA: electron transfer flavoprotein subunit alpha/FixB family protein, partial [Blastocatellia bacterium]|nr:electron transfer flavoprotein subunit alpha/FixB family protein [Blastocatellia bacterium]
MAEGILLFVEQRDGVMGRTTLEALVACQEMASSLGEKISAVVLGKEISAVAAEIAQKKIERVYAVEDDKLAQYSPDGYVAALQQTIEKLAPKFVILSHTYQVRDFIPRLAARLGKTLIPDCIALSVTGSEVLFTRQVFQGKINTDVKAAPAATLFATFQAGSYRADKAESGTQPASIESLAVDLSAVNIRTKSEEKFQEAKQAVDLSQAELIVS